MEKEIHPGKIRKIEYWKIQNHYCTRNHNIHSHCAEQCDCCCFPQTEPAKGYRYTGYHRDNWDNKQVSGEGFICAQTQAQEPERSHKCGLHQQADKRHFNGYYGLVNMTVTGIYDVE